MNKIKQTIAVALFIACLFPPQAFAIVVSGAGKTTAEAIAEARRNALETSIAQIISAEEYKKKRETLLKTVFAEMDNYLQSPDILLEEKMENGVRVTVDIGVNTEKLKKMLLVKEGWIASEEHPKLALFLKKTSSSHLSGGTREAGYAYAELKGILEDEFGYEIIRNSLMESEYGATRRERRSRGRSMSMDQKDALEMANDLGASYAVLFDLRIERKREDRKTHAITCFITFTLYDSRTNQRMETLEIEGDSEQTASRRGDRSSEPSEAVYDAIQSVVSQAAERVHAMISPKAKGDRKKTTRYEMTFKNFDQGEISGLVKKIESMKGFSKLRQIEQTARSCRMEVSADLDLNDFLASVTDILDGSNFQYNMNFDRNQVYITKSRIGGEGKEGEEKVDLYR